MRSRAAASLKMSRRSSAGLRASLSIRAFLGDFLDGGVDPARRRLRIEEYPLSEGRIKLPADLRNNFGSDAAFAKCFKCLHDQATFRQLETGFL